jgi:hypothetical protein
VFQLSGFVTVVLKLVAAKRQFQLPMNSFRQWLGRFPQFPPYHHVLSPEPAALHIEGGLGPRLRVASGPTTPLDQKVALLEQQYAELFDEVGRLDQEVKKNAREIWEALKAEIAERQRAEALGQQLQEAVVGHLELDIAGVLYFIIGTIAATASTEIARWLGAEPCKFAQSDIIFASLLGSH